MRILLKNQTAEDLQAFLARDGVTLSVARRIQASAIRRGEFPAPAPGLSAKVLTAVCTRTAIPHLDLVEKTVSARDQFAKYLFRGDGPDGFEAVRIPLLHRADDPKYVVCVSSQVGCALGCVFCATGRLGFIRNLAAWEIVDQVVKIRADSPHPVRGVVFMGMGEPMLNYESVITAARILSEPCGMAISAKAITIGTAGIVPAIRRFTAEGHAYRLLVSLTCADPARRRELMPLEGSHPTPGLLAALREYHDATGRRVTLAWTMIAGVNTREEDARQLAELTRGLPVKLDLIDVNDPSGRFRPPAPGELSDFRDALRRHLGMPVARRYSGGQDIRAACGMLAGCGRRMLP
ncbi:MAG: radical SAM protein [Verrucomicrobia bacterium]|nr:radical SAM protein [Verrucomicrobiota bacterium]MBU1908817.1 radical SAM protein [Verrucomicrobiota bacterium]